jgi:ribosomal protein S12 methylthiotransferase accessory factor
MSIVEWNQGTETWLLPDGACLECLKAWRGNELSRGWGDPPAKHLRSLISAHKAALAVTPGARPRRIDWLTGQAREHTLNRHPGCDRHGVKAMDRTHAKGMLSRGGEAHGGMRRLSGGELKHAITGLVDSHIGLVRGITEFRNDSPMSGASARLKPLAGPQDVEYGHGRSGSPTADRVTAVAEAVERWGAFRPWRGVELVEASWRDLGDDAVDPRDFILNDEDPDLANWRPYDEAAQYQWVWGWSVRRSAPVLVPLQLVYFGVKNPLGGRFVYEISNGCAGGGSVGEAALYGLLEVIERDAFLTSWHSSRLVDEISLNVLNDWARGVIARLSGEGVEVSLLDIGCGLPGHAVAAEIRDTTGRYLPWISQTAAAHPDPAKACAAALQEGAAMLGVYDVEERAKRRQQAEALLMAPETVLTMHNHAAQGNSPWALGSKAFRRSGNTIAPIRACERDAHALFDEYASATLAHAKDVIVVDQSYTPARERGLHTVKVLAPGLHSMTFGHKRARLSADRLKIFAPHWEWRMEPHLFP